MDTFSDENDFTRHFKKNFDESKDKIWEEADGKINDELSNKLIISFMGSVASGKTTAIKRLFGLPVDNISPLPGSTEKIKLFQVDNNCYIADTPGLLDVKEEISNKTKAFVDSSDIFIYLLNASAVLTANDKYEIDKLVKLNRPILILINKVDLLKSQSEIDDIHHYVCNNLPEIPDRDIINVSFESRNGEESINLEDVLGSIYDIVSKRGKGLLFAKNVKHKKTICDKIILKAVATSTAAGAIPISVADIVIITEIQIRMILSMANVFEKKLSKDDTVTMISTLFAGNAGKQFFRWIISLLKTTDWFPGAQVTALLISSVGAVIAGSITFGFGKTFLYYFENNMDVKFEDLDLIFKEAYESYKKATKQSY
jgi:small GTP-binding protein